ncbi:regulator of G-protein signaling 7 isoform X4 [Strongylocentrotus purpuratus]|uniref:Regulator of G-protein signaling 7 n=1 Tax=Strongylocentrotus purpuratus TaxID=7668 RepID=A0A7M7HKB6_STRPU|nr:regulator of G-protein signaling 7 isoform X4 [Strongylocentrotus purpuratus]|eukprot:XP_011672363.1 PREDICTED: regulator of G-protein signaling 7 isoform X4 [Strongylocentrotus purpuratus]
MQKMAHWRRVNGAGDEECSHPNLIVYRKIERLIQRMQDERNGVPVRTVKSFMSKVPSVFTGADLVQWLMKTLDIDQANSIHLGSLLAAHGYFFPITDHVLTLKDDNTFYRFQTPYFWPSNCWEPENTDYAVYLCKRTMQNKSRLELADYEAENLAKLQRMFSRKWEFIFMQAEAQAKVDKKRDKMERKVLDSQERAFWDVHRPVPGCVNTTEMDIKKLSRINRTFKKKKINSPEDGDRCPSDSDIQSASEESKRQVEMLKARLEKRQYKTSKVAELLIAYCQQYRDYDSFLSTELGPNPWITDDTALWEAASTMSLKEVPVYRVKKWGFSFDDLLKDSLGRDQLSKFLAKEFSDENLRFWIACQDLKKMTFSQVPAKVQQIYSEFLSDSSHSPINVDSKILDTTRKNMKNPNRYTFDAAQEHIYTLMRSDSYPRFLRSEQYKELLNPKKKCLSNWEKTKSLIPKLPSLATKAEVLDK